MADMVEFLKVIKRAALEAVDEKKPVQVCFGKVIGISPLKIQVEQKILLGEAQLILARNVTDFTTEITTVDWLTEKRGGGSGAAAYAPHDHDILGRKKIVVHNGLVVGDEVILLRRQGGQQYIVIDRIGK